jgi:hypothetical protein
LERTPRPPEVQSEVRADNPLAESGARLGEESRYGESQADTLAEHPRRSRNPHCARLVEVARQIVERLPDRDLKGAFLFGSAAWGDADAASDLDIMVLLDRPPGFREVTRRRAADLLGLSAPPQDGPHFVDLDRFSLTAFAEASVNGGPVFRLAHSIILRDEGGLLARLRASATADLAHAEKRVERFRRRLSAATASCTAARQALASNDVSLAVLHSRLAVQEAAGGLIEVNRDRVSVTHFVESATDAFRSLGCAEFESPLLHALALDAPPETLHGSIARSLHAYRVFAENLKRWMDDPTLAGRLSQEDAAWAVFTWCDETFEEIAHKVDTFSALGRLQALQYYLDGLLTVPVRINFGKLFRLRATGESGRLSIPEFHAALREEPALSIEWHEALRLDGAASDIQLAERLVGQLHAAGEAALGAEEDPHEYTPLPGTA